MGAGNSSQENQDPNLHEIDPLLEISELADKALDQTDETIAARRDLTKRFLREIEKEIAEAKRMLRLLGDPWKHGDQTEYEFMRISLDKALTARKKERRSRLLEEWKDLLSLHERRREMLRESVALKSANDTRKESEEGGSAPKTVHQTTR